MPTPDPSLAPTAVWVVNLTAWSREDVSTLAQIAFAGGLIVIFLLAVIAVTSAYRVMR